MADIRIKRGTRAQLDAAASANGLLQGEPYLITDESKFAVGSAANSYIETEPAQQSASQAEMEAGAESAIRSMSPLRVKQAIDELAVTSADVQTNAADRTEGRVARIDLVPMDPFHEICHIAGMEPTLYLDFASQDYRIYNSATGLERKALTDILDSTSGDIRNSTGTAFNALGLLESQAADVPRLDFDPETGLCRGVLVEEARTNLLTYSDQFDNAAWSKSNATVTANAAVAPDGTTTAYKLVDNASNVNHSIRQAHTFSSGSTYVFSCFVKSSDLTRVALRLGDSAAFSTAPLLHFNLNDETTSNASASVLSYTFSKLQNGWFRLSITGTATSSTTGYAYIYLLDSGDNIVYAGDGTSGIYIWGAQLEASSFPTAYIPTTTASATRAADTLTISGTRFSDFYSASNSLLAKYVTEGVMSEQSKSLSTSFTISGYIDGTSGTIANDHLSRLVFFPRELSAGTITLLENVLGA